MKIQLEMEESENGAKRIGQISILQLRRIRLSYLKGKKRTKHKSGDRLRPSKGPGKVIPPKETRRVPKKDKKKRGGAELLAMLNKEGFSSVLKSGEENVLTMRIQGKRKVIGCGKKRNRKRHVQKETVWPVDQYVLKRKKKE